MSVRVVKSCLMLGVSLCVLPQAAFAQETPPTAPDAPASKPDAPDVGDIIVTAQKRSESINRVGMSINAISGDGLTARGITDVGDLAKISPGLTFTPAQFGQPVYVIRGVGLYDTGLGSSPAVTIYTDEVPYASPVMTEVAPGDVERVEVLKGPQGLIFGQNSTGGAINYVLARPTAQWETGVDLSYQRFDQVEASGYVSGPISDTLGVRLSGRVVNGGAWQKSISREDTLGDKRTWQARLLLDWDASDRLTIKINLNGFRDRSDTQASQFVAAGPSNPALLSDYFRGLREYPHDPRIADWSRDGDPLRSNDALFQGTLRADYELGDFGILTSITGYQHFTEDKNVDIGGTDQSYNNYSTGPAAAVRTQGKVDNFYQELRLSGDQGPIKWIVGGNYSRSKIDETQFIVLNETITRPVPNLPPFQNVTGIVNQKIRDVAAFGNLDFSLTSALTLHAGARYTDSRRHGLNCTSGWNYAVSPNAVGNQFNALQYFFTSIGLKTTPVVPLSEGQCVSLSAVPDLSPSPGGTPARLNEDNVSWRFGLDYKLASGALLYANYSRGYKAGVISAFAASATAEFPPAKQERLDAYEVGFKTPLFNRRVHLSGAGFYYDYNDKQLRGRFLDPIFGALDVLQNVPKSRVIGAELSLQAEPIKGLTMSAGGTYLASEITSDFLSFPSTATPADAPTNFRGSPMPFTPKWQAVADGQYTFAVSNRLRAFLGGSAIYHSATNSIFVNDTFPADTFAIPSYTLLDLRAGLESADGAWRVSVFGKNVTNKFYILSVQKNADAFVRYVGQPATYGVRVSFNFR